MRFDLHYDTRDIPFNSILYPLVRVIYIISTSLNQMICFSVIEKNFKFSKISLL